MSTIQRSRRGFTLIELVIVIAVIAILAALLVPTILGQVERAKIAAEKQSINELAKAMRRFRGDMSRWPMDNTTWPMATDLAADEFTFADTALYVMPTPAVQVCSAVNLGELTCWGGPYMATAPTATLNPALIDAWGRPRMTIAIRPFDGFGGGTPGAPSGFVAVWSRGPDGLDGYSCYGAPAGCTRDLDKMARGLTSAATADDLVVVAGTAR